MGSIYEQLMRNMSKELPPAGLNKKILLCIEGARRRRARARFSLYGTLALGTLFLTVPVYAFVVGELRQSGFLEYFSLFLLLLFC